MHIPYRVQTTPHVAIVLDAPSVRRPAILRTSWKPDPAHPATVYARDASIALAHRPAYPVRDGNGYDKRPDQRWTVEPLTPYADPLVLVTPGEGTHEWREAIKAPPTRTPGVWFAWECGEWKRYLPGCTYAEQSLPAKHWHTPKWSKGQDMTPLPPTDYANHQKTLEI